AFQQEEQVRWANDRRRSLRGTGDLSCGSRIVKLERIGPDDGRQPRALFVIRRQVKRERTLHAVGALVRHQLFLDTTQLRRRIRKLRERPSGITTASDEVIRRFGRRLSPRDELLRIVAQQRNNRFIAVSFAAEESLRFERLQVETVEERTIAVGRRA